MKGLSCFFNSSKRRTKNFFSSRLGKNKKKSSSFFGRIEDTKISFRDYLTFKNTSVLVENVSYTGTFTVIKSAQGQPIETTDLILQGITGAIDGAGAAFLKVTAVAKPNLVEFDDTLKPILQDADDFVSVYSDDFVSIYSDDLAKASVKGGQGGQLLSDDLVSTFTDDTLLTLCGLPWLAGKVVGKVSTKLQNIQSKQLKLACLLKHSILVKDALQKSGAIQ